MDAIAPRVCVAAMRVGSPTEKAGQWISGKRERATLSESAPSRTKLSRCAAQSASQPLPPLEPRRPVRDARHSYVVKWKSRSKPRFVVGTSGCCRPRQHARTTSSGLSSIDGPPGSESASSSVSKVGPIGAHLGLVVASSACRLATSARARSACALDNRSSASSDETRTRSSASPPPAAPPSAPPAPPAAARSTCSLSSASCPSRTRSRSVAPAYCILSSTYCCCSAFCVCAISRTIVRSLASAFAAAAAAALASRSVFSDRSTRARDVQLWWAVQWRAGAGATR
eukprot:scaffold48550_cov68-Phaeocystis_antarctica.AAC.7